MRREITIREGSTDYIDLQLFSGEKAVDLTHNNHVELLLVDRSGKTHLFTTKNGKLLITDRVDGKLQLRPGPMDFYHDRSPYSGYIWVYYSPARRGSFPEDGKIRFNITKGIPVQQSSEYFIGAIFSL